MAGPPWQAVVRDRGTKADRRRRLSAALPHPFCLTNQRESITIPPVSASEIIQELPKLSDAERRAILDKLRELAQVDDDRWEELLNDPKPRPKLEAFLRESVLKAEFLWIPAVCEIIRSPEFLAGI